MWIVPHLSIAVTAKHDRGLLAAQRPLLEVRCRHNKVSMVGYQTDGNLLYKTRARDGHLNYSSKEEEPLEEISLIPHLHHEGYTLATKLPYSDARLPIAVPPGLQLKTA